MEQGILLFVRKHDNPKSKTVYLAAMYINVFFVHFLSQCRNEGKNVKKLSGGLQLSSGGLKSITASLGAS
jgi:hypothetical protein